MRKLFLLFLSALFISNAAHTTSFAVMPINSEGWVIEGFISHITIQKDTTTQIEETISVDFKSLQKHGIYRIIPVKYKDKYGNNLDIRFQSLSVKDENGFSRTVEQSYEGNNVKLKVGDADKTISGKQTYIISYQVERVITQPTQDAELYWNVTGNDWEVPILSAKATIDAPPGSLKDVTCFTGRYGSNEQECSKNKTSDTATFSTRSPLSLGSGLTVAVALDPTQLILPTFWQKIIWFLKDNWLYATPLVALAFMLRLWWTKGRDRQYKNMFNEQGDVEAVPFMGKFPIPSVYGPNKDVAPGEAGVIVDEKVDLSDMTAVMIDLARRGYFKITEIAKKGVFGKTDYELTLLGKEETTLRKYEQSILDMFFGSKRSEKTVRMNKLRKDSYASFARAKDELYKAVTEQGYYAGNPAKVKITYLFAGLAIGGVGFFTMAAGSQPAGGLAWLFACGISGFVVAAVGWFMPARTAKGSKALREILGLREWVRVGAWREQILEKLNLFEEVLPYAIAFGLTEKFIKAFPETQMKKLSWYQSSGAFTTNNFVFAMSNFGHTATTSAAAAAPHSASHGGSGFGGGGGGSW